MIPSNLIQHEKITFNNNEVIFFKKNGSLSKICNASKNAINLPTIDNIPTKGFELLEDYQIKRKSTKIAIRDPRGASIELDYENIIELAQHSSVGPNCLIQDECVYAFDNNRAWLISVNSPAYQKLQQIKIATKITPRIISPGTICLYKNTYPSLYIGEFNIYEYDNDKPKKSYVFHRDSKYFYLNSLKSLYFYDENQLQTLSPDEQNVLSKILVVDLNLIIDDFHKKYGHLAGVANFVRFEYKKTGNMFNLPLQKTGLSFANYPIWLLFKGKIYKNSYYATQIVETKNNQIYVSRMGHTTLSGQAEEIVDLYAIYDNGAKIKMNDYYSQTLQLFRESSNITKNLK